MSVGRSSEEFFVVLRARGRSAGGTASLSRARRPGLRRDFSLHLLLSASLLSYEATYLPGVRFDPRPFHRGRVVRRLVIFAN